MVRLGAQTPAAGEDYIESTDGGILIWAAWLGEQAQAENFGRLEDYVYLALVDFRGILVERIPVLRLTRMVSPDALCLNCV